ncbi:MAG: amidohydrolase family protein [Acidimicrobiaceae bacterium]|nr:amidohydrolase family protein [Acidimicrobiaceae bacterium]MCY4293262.1 amidohydrolase family protein [Acidimicrobiaceae bacterium]
MSIRIDSHHHYWDPERGDYPWMPSEGPLARPYLPADHAPLNEAAGIDGTVAVQAAPTLAETRWLCEQADSARSNVVGVVGWVDLAAADVEAQIEAISHRLLVGVRPMLQDIDDIAWIKRPEVIDGLRAVQAAGLSFDVLIRTEHLEAVVEALDELPGLVAVVDHLAKPDYARVEEAWLDGMRALSAREHTFIKISGLATEVEAPWRPASFSRHTEAVLDLFGPRRSMVGTDWPVSLLAGAHAETVALLDQLTAHLTDDERSSLWAGACLRAYNIDI